MRQPEPHPQLFRELLIEGFFSHVRSKRGMKAAAVLYSLLKTARLCQVDPGAYLAAAADAALQTRGNALVPREIAC